MNEVGVPSGRSRFLIIESELPDERAARRTILGKSSGESFAATLHDLTKCETMLVRPAEGDVRVGAGDLPHLDAVFLSGSPIHVYDGSEEVRRLVDYMRLVFASRVPSFGSCAGLHIATAAAGGTVRPMRQPMEAGIGRRISATSSGATHQLLDGRAAVWDAPSIHGDEVVALPAGSRLLATNAVTTVQAAEILHEGGVFWGVQYHPELSPGEIAAALRRQAKDLVANKVAENDEQVEARAYQLEALGAEPDRISNRWLLGVDAEFAAQDARRREISNFLAALPSLLR